MTIQVRVLDDPASETARRLAAAAGEGGHVVLTGGSTPRTAYERAAALGGDWSRATLWWGDERCVAPEDPLSNYGLAREALLSRVDPLPGVERIEGERGPAAGAERYGETQRGVRRPRPRPSTSLLLGLGPDGHCASLFPGAPALEVSDRWVVGVERPGTIPSCRVSLTLPGLGAAHETLFVVTGSEKADAVRRAFGAEGDDSSGPPGRRGGAVGHRPARRGRRRRSLSRHPGGRRMCRAGELPPPRRPAPPTP